MKKLSDDELKNFYGFSKSNKNAKVTLWDIFLSIPIYPSVITFNELSKTLKVKSAYINGYIRAMPTLAPIIEINKHTLSRLK